MAADNILARMSVLISAKTAEFEKALQRSQTQLSSFVGSIQKMAGTVGLAFGAFEAFNVVKSAINSVKEFEETLSTVRAITGATDKEFKQLKKSALDLGASTRYTAKEVAQLQIEYGRLGFSTKEILAATAATLDLATATGSDLAKSADVAGSTVRGFGLEAEETRRVVDVMAESFNKSALGLENFSEAMKYVAPVAAQAGLSVEETTALLGTLADSGIRGSMAGTSLRKIISDLGTVSGDLSTRLQKLADKGLDGAAAMDEVGRTAYASLLILAKNTGKTRELTQELNYAAGAGKEAAKIMGDNLAGDLIKLESAYDGFIQTAGEGNTVLREVTQSLTGILSAINSNNAGLGDMINKYLKLAFVVPRTFLGGLKGIAEYAGGVHEANRALAETERKQAIIDENVRQAWKGGFENLDTYIKALDGVEYEYEIINAILEKFRKELQKTNEEALTPQLGILESLELKLKNLEEARKKAFSVDAIARFNDEIKKTREEIDLLLASGIYQSPFSRQQEKNALAGNKTDVTELGARTNAESPINKDAAMLGSSIFPDITDQADLYIQNIQRVGETEEEWAERMSQLRERHIAEWQSAADAAVMFGDIVGEGLGAAISGQESFADAVKKTTAQLIKAFLQRALAAAFAKGVSETPGPPPVGLAVAAAAVGVVSAFFAKLGSGGGGGGAGGASSSRSVRSSERYASATSATAQDSAPEVIGVLRGQDLWLMAKNVERNDKKTRGG